MRFAAILLGSALVCMLPMRWSSAFGQEPPPTSTPIKVGIYQNEPKVFLDKSGDPTGFWVDLLNHIAVEEQWTVEYVFCHWDSCLQSVEAHQLDLMVDVAYSEERDRRFDFNQEVVLASWSVIYAQPGLAIDTILDLDKKQIAVLKDSIQYAGLQEQSRNFGIQPIFVEVTSFDDMFHLMEAKAVDGGVVNYLFGQQAEADYKISKTSILIAPSRLHFIAPRNQHAELLVAIDHHLVELTNDSNSVYYQALARWLRPPERFGGQQIKILGTTLLIYAPIIGLVVAVMWNRVLRREIHRRKRVEAQLRDSEQRYARLAEAVPVGIFRTDANGQNIYANEYCCEIVDLPPEEVSGTGWTQWLHPDDRDLVRNAWRQTLQTQEAFQEEYRFLHPDGTISWVYGQCVAETDGEGKITGYVGTLTDISERKRSEEALQKSEAHQRALVSAMPDLIMRMDKNGIYQEFLASPTFHVLGNLVDWVGTHVSKYLPQHLAQQRLESVHQALRTHSIQIYEQELVMDGVAQMEEVRVVPYSDDEALLLVRDITDRKQAEQALATSEAQSRALLAAIPDLMFRVDRDGICCGLVSSTTNFDLFPKGLDIRGKALIDVSPPELGPRHLHFLHQALDTGRLQVYEQTIQVGDRLQYEEVRVIKSSEDEVLFVIRDITERKLTEEQLKDSEQRFRHAIEVASFPMMIHAEDGEVLQINAVWTELTGYHLCDIPTTQAWTEKAYGDRASYVLDTAIKEAYTSESRWEKGEFYVKTATGTERIWQFSSAPLGELPDGRRAAISMAVDVTQQRQAALALQESEQRFRNMAANVPGAIFKYVLHPDGTDRVIYMSSGCYALWEVRAEAVIEDASILWEVIHSDDRAAMYDSVMESARTLRPWFYQWRIMTPSGNHKWLEAAGRPTRKANGDVVWDTLMMDVSDRKQAEAALQSSEEKLRLITENMSDLVCLHYADGRYLYVTPSIQPLLGYHPSELLGHNPVEYVHPDDRDRLWWNAQPLGPAHQPTYQPTHQPTHQPDKAPDKSLLPATYRFRQKSGDYIWLETLVKPILNEQGQVQHLQTTSRNVSDRISAEQQLKHDALHDRLTGLPNRSLFTERLELVIKRSKRQPHLKFAVLFLDLDNFKVVNDSLGHLVGDELLIAVANHLKTFIRDTDIAARLGGDEFVILLEDIDEIQDGVRVAQRILETLRLPFTLKDRDVFTSTSIGIVVGASNHYHADDLLRDADLAMYRAKQNGRSQYAIFDPTMHLRAVERLRLEQDLRKAIEQAEFELYYQPIVQLESLTVKGFEALIRWHHPKRGFVSPGDFIEIAEETGLIVPIGQWILHTACQQVAQWQAALPTPHPLSISVNLSVKQLQPELLDDLDQVLRTTAIPAHCLILEITESMVVENLQATCALLEQIQAKGIRISIDDFGTGYSSLSYLHQLPVQSLKIDRAFVSPLEQDARNQVIAESIIALSNLLGLKAIAEGIETSEQLAWLQKLGCELGQGFLFSPPVPAPQAMALLRLGLNPRKVRQ